MDGQVDSVRLALLVVKEYAAADEDGKDLLVNDQPVQFFLNVEGKVR
jgi:hypothetical protein